MFDKKSYFLFSVVIILFVALMGLCCYRVYEVANKEENNNQNIPQLPSDSGNNDDDNIDIESRYYTISFDTDGGSEVEDIRVKYGTKVKLPSTYKIDYTFSGWIFENKIVDENYEVKNDMLLKANWKRNEEEQIKDDDKEIIEYNFDKIEEFVDNKNSIMLLSKSLNYINVRYVDNGITIETLLGNEKNSYLKVNDKIIDVDMFFYFDSVRVFKFNNVYVIEYSTPHAQCLTERAIILNDSGEIIGKIGFEEGKNVLISYEKEKNQIKVSFSESCVFGLRIYEILEEVYEINKNDLLFVENNYYNNKVFVYESYNNSYAVSNYKLDNNLVQTYQCDSNDCKGFNIFDENILLYDNGYYLYNYKNDTKKLIASKELNGSLNYMLDKTTTIFETKNIIFHNNDEEMYYIYDENGDYITKINNEPYRFIIDNKTYYFTEIFISKEKGNTVEIYNSEFKKLWDITGLSKQYKNLSGTSTAISPGHLDKNRIINSNNTITFNAEKDGVYVLFDSDMNLIHESKKYEIIDIVNDYVVVIDENKLKILDLNENVVAKFDYLPNAYKFDNVYIDESDNLTIRAYDYENGKYVYYYFNTLTKETNIEKD